MHKSIGVAVAGSALLVGLAGCGGSSTPPSTSVSTTTSPSSTDTTTIAPSTTAPPRSTTSTTVAPVTTVAGVALSSLVLPTIQVTQLGGTLVSVQTAPGGTSLATATLDVCAPSFPSEKLRTARLQVDFLGGDGQVSASSEIVRYSAGGAAESYQELRTAVAHCAPTSGFSDLQVSAPDPSLTSEQVIISGELTNGGTSMFAASAYQYKNDLLYGLYTFRATRAQAVQSAEAIAAGATAKLDSAGA